MKLIRQPNAWSCTIASAAMVMGTSIEELIEEIGHDGSAIINPDFKSPGNRKGFHIQEIIDAAWSRGYTVTPIDAVPCQTVKGDDVFKLNFPEERLLTYLKYNQGLLMGKSTNYWHCVAWNKVNIFDPRGKVYPLEECKIAISQFWIFKRIC